MFLKYQNARLLRDTVHVQFMYSSNKVLVQFNLFAVWEKMQERKQLRIQQSNICEKSKRILHKYSEGDMITLRNPGAILHTLALPQRGPYKVINHHGNGSIKLKLEPNVVDRVNIRRCNPYYLLPEDENGPDVNTQQAVDIRHPTAFM